MESCEYRVWYPRQPPQCSICREFGHRAPACPLSDLCRRCCQPGHMARECTQAWGPSDSVFSPASDGSSDESDHAMEQLSPSPSIVASVAVSAESTPNSFPHESGRVMEELPLACLPLPLQLPCLLLLLPFLSLLSCLSPLLPLPHLLLLQLPLPLLWLPLLFLLQLLRLFLPLIQLSFLLPRCLLLLLLLPVITIIVSFPVIRTPLKKNLTSFEKEHFCPKNVMPERLCFAHFRTFEYLMFQGVLSAITNSGVPAEDVRCIQYNFFFQFAKEVHITFSSPTFCSRFVNLHRWLSTKILFYFIGPPPSYFCWCF